MFAGFGFVSFKVEIALAIAALNKGKHLTEQQLRGEAIGKHFRLSNIVMSINYLFYISLVS